MIDRKLAIEGNHDVAHLIAAGRATAQQFAEHPARFAVVTAPIVHPRRRAPPRRILRALAVAPQIAHRGDPKASEMRLVGLGEHRHHARSIEHAVPDATAVRRRIAAHVAQIIAALERQQPGWYRGRHAFPTTLSGRSFPNTR